MTNIVPLRAYTDVSYALRELATMIDEGKLPAQVQCTVVIDRKTFILGPLIDDDLAAKVAAFELLAAANQLAADYTDPDSSVWPE